MGIGDISNTGMQAAMSNMEVISNNIANANTIGFKRSYVNFADIYPSANGAASNQPGLGVDIQSILQDFSRGDPSFTGGQYDMAVDKAGFFVLHDPNSGQISYTRAGRFIGKDGYLTYGNQRLQGFAAVNNAIPSGSNMSDIQISTAALPATPSTTANMAVNLSSNNAVPAGAFDPTLDSTYNYNSNVQIYDSLGNSHQVTNYYVMTAPDQWNVYVYVDGTSVTASPGTATFATNGVLTSTTGLTGLSFTPTSGAATPQSFQVNLNGCTQNSTANALISQSADGTAPAAYSNTTVNGDGMVYNIYANNQQVLVGQVAIANFQAPQALSNIGNMQWVSNSSSGSPLINQGNSSGNIDTGYVELSNVDLTTEMVNLITAQHTFQANAQVEQTYNEVMNTVIKL